MGGVIVKRLGELETSMGGGFGHVGKGLGVSAFGINALRLPPDYDGYPEHDEAESRQDEVYVVVKGSARLVADGEEHELTPLSFAHVPCGVKRKWLAGPEGVTIVAVGGVPGAVEPR